MDRIIEVKVVGNYLSKDNKTAGVRGEANVTKLRITFDEGWNAYTKKITFWNARGLNPVEIVLLPHLAENENTYFVPIPAEPMEEAGMLTFVIEGTVDEKVQRSVLDKLEVKDAPIAQNAGQPVPPTDDALTQLEGEIEKIKSDILDAKNAKKDADAAKSYMDAADSHSKSAKLYRDEASQSAKEAGDSASKAEEAVGKTPYIGYNGNWFAWDVEKKAFYDTGVRANGHSPILKKHEITAIPDASRVEMWGGDCEHQDGKFILSANAGYFLQPIFPTGFDVSALLGKTVNVSFKVEEQKSGGQPYRARYNCCLMYLWDGEWKGYSSFYKSFDGVEEGNIVSFSTFIDTEAPNNRDGELGIYFETMPKDNGTGSDEYTVVISDFIINVATEGDEEWYVWDDEQQTYVYSGVKAKGQDGYTPQRGTDYWTEEDKAEILDDMSDEGYVKNTDYATHETAGVVKVSNYTRGLYMDNGILTVYGAEYSDIKAKISWSKPITPVNLEYAVQVCTNQDSSAELTEAQLKLPPSTQFVKDYIDETFLGGAW